MKPRIKYERIREQYFEVPFVAIHVLPAMWCWTCNGDGRKHSGWTPEVAYQNWLEAGKPSLWRRVKDVWSLPWF